jgi:hypothetical protein
MDIQCILHENQSLVREIMNKVTAQNVIKIRNNYLRQIHPAHIKKESVRTNRLIIIRGNIQSQYRLYDDIRSWSNLSYG